MSLAQWGLAAACLAATITVSDPARAQDNGDAALVQTLCGSCHTYDPGAMSMQGPHFRRVFGRKAGSVRGFTYSEPLRTLDVTWTEATLTAYLSNPREYLPGTKKVQPIRNPEDLRRVIAYLKATQSMPQPANPQASK